MMSQTLRIEIDRFRWKKSKSVNYFISPSKMKLAGTSDHSQYLFVVSRLTECTYDYEIGFAHVSVTALNQCVTNAV